MLLCAAGNAAGQSAQPAAGQSAAQEAVRAFDIPAQSLAGALSAFNRQTGIQVTQASGAASRSLTVNAVRGRMTPQQALSRMLGGTGISWQFTGNDAVVVGNRQTIANGAAPQGDGATVLDTITVTGKGARNAASGSGFQGTPDWVYETPASVSVISRQAIQNTPVRNTRDLLDNVAGVYANRSEGQNPGITVNVRGLQDQNRIVTMIDGARQNFQRNGHGASERAYVDTAFVRQVEVEKAGTSGVGGAGSLGGSVNFRTIVADDIIIGDKKWGVEINGGTGSNSFYFDGSAAAAFRISDNLSILGGVSRKRVGEYDVGKRGDLRLYDSSARDGVIVSTGQEVLSTILKTEAKVTDDLDVTLGWVRNHSDFSHGSYNLEGDLVENLQDVLNNTLTSHFHWDPESDLINLNARVWYNRTKNEEQRAPTAHNPIWYPIDYQMGTLGASLDNTSTTATPIGALSLNYGVEAFWDRAKTDAPTYLYSDGTDFTSSYTGTTPSGNRDVYSTFANATLEHDDWLVVSGGLRYDHYRLHGSTSVFTRERTLVDNRVCVRYYADGVRCRSWEGTYELVTTYPETKIDIDRSEGAFLPTAEISVKPYEWLQPFAKYSRSFRPPTVMEAFVSGGHPGANITDFAPNPNLAAESGDTFEMGANIAHDGLLSASDSFRFKAVGFYRIIDDYIALGQFYSTAAAAEFSSPVNIDGTTRMKGIEIEANYDAGRWYAGLSYTHLKTDFGNSYTYNGSSHEIQPSVIFVPPRNKMTVDAGVRLFDEKLTLGGRVNAVGGATPTTGVLQGNYATKDYTLYDAYGSYDFNDRAKLRVAVNNITDVAYIPALGTIGLPSPGRTVTASLSFKF